MNLIGIYRIEVGMFLLGLLLALIYKMATGRISLRGIFGNASGSGSVYPERVLLFAATLAIGVVYMVRLVLVCADAMPSLGAGWVTMFGLCGAAYVITEAFRSFRAKKN